MHLLLEVFAGVMLPCLIMWLIHRAWKGAGSALATIIVISIVSMQGWTALLRQIFNPPYGNPFNVITAMSIPASFLLTNLLVMMLSLFLIALRGRRSWPSEQTRFVRLVQEILMLAPTGALLSFLVVDIVPSVTDVLTMAGTSSFVLRVREVTNWLDGHGLLLQALIIPWLIPPLTAYLWRLLTRTTPRPLKRTPLVIYLSLVAAAILFSTFIPMLLR